MLRFLKLFDLPEGAIQTHFVESTWRTTPARDREIDRVWNEILTRPGVRLFDGPMCRLESWISGGDTLDLNFSLTSYRLFVGTNIAIAQRPDDSITDEFLARSIGVSPALVSSDGFLLMGRRNASVAYYPNRLHPFAGAIEPRGESVNLFVEVRRELREELSLNDQDIAEIRCTGIVEDTTLRHPEMMFAVRSNRTRAEIESQVDAGEHFASWSVKAAADEVSALFRSRDAKLLTPVAIASLLLFGRLKFGQKWFAENCLFFNLTTDH